MTRGRGLMRRAPRRCRPIRRGGWRPTRSDAACRKARHPRTRCRSPSRRASGAPGSADRVPPQLRNGDQHLSIDGRACGADPEQRQHPRRIGPSFDCKKAARPLALMICASPDLSREDLRFVQAYQALPDPRLELRDSPNPAAKWLILPLFSAGGKFHRPGAGGENGSTAGFRDR